MADSVLGIDWFRNFIRFRETKGFAQKVTPDVLTMHILKDLYSESISTQNKVHLLLMFQEHPLFLIQDELILDKVVTSFKSLYNSIDGSDDKKLIKSQLLITATTVLLTWKTMNESVSKLIIDVLALLLEIVLNDKTHHVVRSSACRCLEEIETCYPGILRDKLHLIYMAYRNILIPSMHSFALLLSICLKHDTDFQLNRRKPWFIENTRMVLSDASPSVRCDPGQVRNILDCILDNAPYINGACFYIVCLNLMHVIKNNKELLPTVFKSFVPKLIRSSDALHFHLAFIFQKLFGLELLTSVEEKLLLQQLLINVSHPCLTVSHRLLYLDWLESCLVDEGGFINYLSRSSLYSLVPGPFDGPHTYEKKIRFLALYFQRRSLFDECCPFLINCLSGLKRQVIVSSSTKISAAFFRSMFVLYSALKSPTVQSSIDKMVLDVVTFSPHLSAYMLDLTNCFKNENNKSFLNTSLLTMLVDHLVNLPIQKLECKLESYLPILEKAALVVPSICKPEVIVRQLKKLLSAPTSCEAYKWISGYYILLMCNTFMKIHDIDILYHGLGELLQLLMKNSKDTHIQVQAKQYYAALTSLPKDRIKALCSSQPFDQQQSQLTYVDGKSQKFQSKNVVSKLSDPVFELIRLEKDYDCHTALFCIKRNKSETGFGESYEEFVKSSKFQPIMKIPFLLRHVANVAEMFTTLYSLTVDITPSIPFLKIPSINVPLLTKIDSESDKGIPVKIEFALSAPYPLSLYFKAKFTTNNGFNYSFLMPPVYLELQDLFLVIPVSSDDASQLWLAKQLMFKELWQHFSSKENQCCLSTFRLKMKTVSIDELVEKFWQPFVMEHESDTFGIGIFLPPSSHLLLKLEVINQAVLVTLLTDNSIILPYISLYLQKLIGS